MRKIHHILFYIVIALSLLLIVGSISDLQNKYSQLKNDASDMRDRVSELEKKQTISDQKISELAGEVSKLKLKLILKKSGINDDSF